MLHYSLPDCHRFCLPVRWLFGWACWTSFASRFFSCLQFSSILSRCVIRSLFGNCV